MNDKHLEVLKNYYDWLNNQGRRLFSEKEYLEAFSCAITQLEKPRLEKLDEEKVEKVEKVLISAIQDAKTKGEFNKSPSLYFLGRSEVKLFAHAICHKFSIDKLERLDDFTFKQFILEHQEKLRSIHINATLLVDLSKQFAQKFGTRKVNVEKIERVLRHNPSAKIVD